jgi:hypothetical protein
MQLPMVLVLDFRKGAVCRFTRCVERHYPHGVARLRVQKRRREFAIIKILHSPLAQSASRHRVYSIGSAAVYLDEHDYVFLFRPSRIGDAYALASEQGHSHAQNLARAHVTVR